MLDRYRYLIPGSPHRPPPIAFPAPPPIQDSDLITSQVSLTDKSSPLLIVSTPSPPAQRTRCLPAFYIMGSFQVLHSPSTLLLPSSLSWIQRSMAQSPPVLFPT